MVYIILGKGFEPMEAVAPCDILRRGGADVRFAGIGGTLIEGSHGICVQADCTVEEMKLENADMVILPGGLGGVHAILASETAMNFIRLAYEKNYSTSIERLAEVAPALAAQMDMYATVKAVQYSGSAKPVITQEYRASEYVSSNTSNTLYADKSKSGDVKISTFRHLSNIRYYEASETVTFELTNKDMDWASVGTGVYDLVDGSVAGRSVQTLSWKENSKDATVDFPTIPELSKTQVLAGKSDSYKISNIHIGGASVINDTTAAQLSTNKSEYFGIFGEIEGTVEKLTLQDPKVTFDDSTSKYTALKGIGALCGRSSGSLLNLTVKVKNDDTVVMDVSWTNSSTKTAGAGIIAGVLDSGSE